MSRKIYIGSTSSSSDVWRAGDLAEEYVVRNEGTSGALKAGFWRTSATAPGCRADGSCLAAGETPYHDAVVVLEGSGTVTVPSTGTKVRIEPGLIVSHPRGIETQWDIDGPYLKKFFVEWNRSRSTQEPGDIHIGHVADNPELWQTCNSPAAPENGAEYGETYLIREEITPSDTFIAGIWRAGTGVRGARSNDLTSLTYDGANGDLTLLLLEGRGQLRDDDSGDIFELKSGDVVGLSAGIQTSWTSLTPFVKAFFVVTMDDP